MKLLKIHISIEFEERSVVREVIIKQPLVHEWMHFKIKDRHTSLVIKYFIALPLLVSSIYLVDIIRVWTKNDKWPLEIPWRSVGMLWRLTRWESHTFYIMQIWPQKQCKRFNLRHVSRSSFLLMLPPFSTNLISLS